MIPRPITFVRSISFIHATVASLICLSLATRECSAGYEVPNPAYNAPVNYYNAATGTGAALRANLHNITSVMTLINYGDSRYAMDDIYRDPNNANNVLLTYSRASISGTWDGGVTWNREHLWPQSKLGISVSNTYKGPGSDLFELRPAGSSTNSSRGNKAYGNPTTIGGYSSTTTSFFPGDADKGDVARALFYMATRYYTGSGTGSSTNLSLVNGTNPATYQMGDLQSLLHWNYQDGVDNFERRANQTIYSGWFDQVSGTTKAQGNRNPYVDHPEYVWAVYGDSANDSQISVAAPASNGTSATNVDVGRVMKNGTLGTKSVAVNKTGADPTTFNISTSGNAITIASGSALVAGVGQPMDYGAQSRTITAGLNASTATTGLKTGTISIDDTDLTTAGAGKGAADGDDTITVTGSVLDQRVVTASVPSMNLGTVITGASVNRAFSLSTSGDINSRTSVNVAGTSATDANGFKITGTTAAFNSDTSTSARTLTGTLTGAGAKSGTLGLAVTTAENGGAGLAGEGTYSAVSVGYTANVLAHSNASFSGGTDMNTLAINFGQLTEDSGAAQRSFDIANLMTSAGFTAGLDLTNLTAAGSGQFSTDLSTFNNELAGDDRTFHALLDTSTPGLFSATYMLFVSDQRDLQGATAGTALTLNLTGQVMAIPEPASLVLLLTGATGLMMRRRRH